MKKSYSLINKILTKNLIICDVGAAGGIQSRWEGIDNLIIVGFEPDVREFNNLPKLKNQKWFNIGLNHRKGTFPLYITGYQTNVSLYKPNRKFIDDLCYDQSDFDIEKEIDVPCDTLDNVLNSDQLLLDYIKIDTQGSELDILKGATNSLSNDIFAVEVEVEFNELYQNQPFFADVDIFLRDCGYILMDIGNMLHVKGKHTVGIGGSKAILISGDALYFKSINNVVDIIKRGGFDKLNSIVAICLVYGYSDYAIEICIRLQRDNIFNADRLEELIQKLKHIRLKSYYIPDFKIKSYINKAFISLSLLFNSVKNASWINDLGNPTE